MIRGLKRACVTGPAFFAPTTLPRGKCVQPNFLVPAGVRGVRCGVAPAKPSLAQLTPWLVSEPNMQTSGLGECLLSDVTEILWLFGMRPCYRKS